MHRHVPASFKRHESGAVAVLVAVLLVVLLGFAALAIDVGHAMLVRGQMQNAADAAAHAGAVKRAGSGSFQDAKDAAKQISAANGFTITDDDISIPPGGSGTYAANDQFVRVTFTKPTSLFLGQVIGASAWQIKAEAVAGNTKQPSPSCLVALEYLELNANNAIVLDGCSAVIGAAKPNSKGYALQGKNQNYSALKITNSLASIDIYNSGSVDCAACTQPTPTKRSDTFTPPAIAPLPGGTTVTKPYCSTNNECTPGVYADQLTRSGTTTFKPGVYVFQKGLNLSGTVSGNGVSWNIANGASFVLDKNITLTLVAPACTDPSGGIAISSQSQGATTLNFTGNPKISIKGIMDIRYMDIDFGGSATFTLTGSVIAKSIHLNGMVTQKASLDSCDNLNNNTTSKISLFE